MPFSGFLSQSDSLQFAFIKNTYISFFNYYYYYYDDDDYDDDDGGGDGGADDDDDEHCDRFP